MIGYFLFITHVVFSAMVQGRTNHGTDGIPLKELITNDANLNPGFDLDAFRLDQLKLHNYYRSLHGVPSMTRDANLENSAQKYAEKLARENRRMLYHCNSRSCNPQAAGENLATGGGNINVEVNATKLWYDEVWDFNYCHHETNFNRPGHEGKAIGHFTQVVWKTSTKLGIGYARTTDRRRVFVVGRYLAAGNYNGQYTENVPKATYLFQTFQNDCGGDNGGFTAWSKPGKCSQSCGGGIRLQTRTCTNPKPSLNGRDCRGETKKLGAQEWCNIESCSGNTNHRDQQCQARGHPAKSWIFHDQCKLYCHSGSSNVYTRSGKVDDGTHCNSQRGACVDGKCKTMLQYVSPKQPLETKNAAQITGSYTGIPSSNWWNNIILTIPNGATNVVIINKNYNAVSLKVGYRSPARFTSYQFSEASWMNRLVKLVGFYETKQTVKGVTFDYKRTRGYSTFTIAGPVQPTPGYNLVLIATGSSSADISWNYTA